MLDTVYHSVYILLMDNQINYKNEIFNCSLELFSQRGFEAVGIQEICNRAGITKPTLYYYFGSKEGLMDEILKESYGRLNRILIQEAVYRPKPHSYHEDVFPLLSGIINAYFDYAKESPLHYKLILSFQFLHSTSQVAMIANNFQQQQLAVLEKMFGEIANTHGNMKNKERSLAHSFLALINGYINLWYREGTIIDQQLAKDITKQFMHGIFS